MRTLKDKVKAHIQGTSLCVNIPIAIRRVCEIEAGDMLTIEVDYKNDSLILRKVKK
jgi:antitoxin component of MazEF toxin-antitoxin module